MDSSTVLDELRIKKNISNELFDVLFPSEIKGLSDRHWTSVFVAKISADYFCNQKHAKVLDIGSGAGKFCFVGATLHPKSEFHGVDIRKKLVDIANEIKNKYAVSNTHFFQQDVLHMDFNGYDAIYLFNPFQEKIDASSIIDKDSAVDIGQYINYTTHIYNELHNVAVGTKLVTYFCEEFCIPKSFKLIASHMKGELKFYLKDLAPEDAIKPIDNEAMADHIDRLNFFPE
jgi:predicted RNA methylase